MPARRIIIDCDPGQDDAVMLLLALASPDELEVLGITAVAGNVPLKLTQRNARLMCELADRADVEVYAGCPRPMVRELITAENVHGKTGIDGMEIHEPAHALNPRHAVEFIIDTLRTVDRPVTLVPTGPLTNIAMALVMAPAIAERIERVVLMGGALREGGNTSASAEFNILVDPHAAHVVFGCGRPIVAMGLDVTHQVLATRARIEPIRALGTRATREVCAMLEYFQRYDREKYGFDGAPLHDPCTIAYLLEPNIFAVKACNVAVEFSSELTMGHTAVDFWDISGRPKNALWAHSVDADRFYALLTERLARL